MDHKDSIPIKSLFREMWKKGGVSEISIPELVSKSERNVIVVDGQNFYGHYVYPRFDWVYGCLIQLSEIVRAFVNPFKNAGVKLVFVMTDGHLDEGRFSLGCPQWQEAHKEFAQYAVKFYNELKRPNSNIEDLIKLRNYHYTPFHALSVVIYILRDELNCDVHLVYPGYRCDEVTNYARENNCLAVLAYDKTYLFYNRAHYYLLSLKHLKLYNLRTSLYDPKVLPRIFGMPEEYICKPIELHWERGEIVKHFFEMLEKFVGEIQNETFVQHGHDIITLSYLKTAPVEYIYSNDYEDDSDSDENEDTNLNWLFDSDSEEKKGNAPDVNVQSNKDPDISSLLDQNASVDKEVNAFSSTNFVRKLHPLEKDYVRFKVGYQYYTPCGPLGKWDFIVNKSRELYKKGHMNRRINILLDFQYFFDDTILEDFCDVMPSAILFRPLRERLYGILFYEAEENIDGIVIEMCICDEGFKKYGVFPKELTSSLGILHPGLLTLWDEKSISDDAIAKKWELFCGSISSHLDPNLLRAVPPTLVVPTVVLFYLCHVNIPCINEKGEPEKVNIMKPWEVEVFIAQAAMLQKDSVRDSVSKLVVKKYKPRVMKLIAVFAYGCQMVQHYLEVCGNPISRRDMCLLHFFDGKLYESIYEKALWRPKADFFCHKDVMQHFNAMKQVILPNSNFPL